MPSYKIVNIDSTGATVQIDFEKNIFKDFDNKGKEISTSKQTFKFDAVDFTSAEAAEGSIAEFVNGKILELGAAEIPAEVMELVGETVTVSVV